MATKTILWAALCGLSICARGQSGLQGEYFNGREFEKKVLTRIDPQINFVWDNVAPAPGLDPHVFSVRWTGFIKAPETGIYRFRAHIDDGIRVFVGDNLVIDAWDLHDSEAFEGEIKLSAGRQYTFKVEYFNAINEGEIQLYWQLPSERPVLGGLLGYNDHSIDNHYLAPPQQIISPAPVRPVLTPPKHGTPAPAKPTNPASPPPVKKVPVTAIIEADTLEKYIPKNIFFEKSKSIMLPASEPDLDNLAGFLLRHPNYTLIVKGHTDRIGNSAKNMILSRERAQAVAAYLTRKGIAASRITATGYGDTQPLVREPDGVANAKNRRVEFIIQE